jgi:endoglucanase
MVQHVATQGTPPQEVNSRTGAASGNGSAGFSAALLPMLASTQRPDAMRQQRLRIDAKAPLERSDNYYDQALTLFGLGWTEGLYRFARDGALLPRWTCA